MRRGAEFFAYEIMDAVVDNFLPVIERLNERSDEIEDEIFAAAEESMLADVTSLKRSSLRLRRALMPQREVFNLLSRHEMDSLSEEAQRYYRDIYDNVVRMETMAEILRERADTALTMYLSVVANRQNETMKVLSMVAAIFLPLTLLAGLYGMNFDNMPELHVSWAYFAVVGFIVTTIVVTLWLFWLGRWFRIGRRRLKRFVPTAVDPERLARYVNQRTPWR
jgi:magnesium transporter